MIENKHRGNCFCSNIQFEIIDTGGTVAACHCLDCRKASGAPFMVFVVVEKIILLKADNPVQFNMKMDSRFEHFVKTVAHQSATREKIDPIKYILEQCFWKTRLT